MVAKATIKDVYQVEWQEEQKPKAKAKKSSPKIGSGGSLLYASTDPYPYTPRHYAIVWADDIIKAVQKFIKAKPKCVPMVVSRLQNYEAII